MKKYIFLWAIILIAAGCKDEDEEKQSQVCSCSSTYTEYYDTTSTPSSIFIPNIFTPNGDGVNDIFYIYGQGLSQTSIVIKDGTNIVFSSNNLSQGWDGSINGNTPPACQTFDYFVDVTFANGTSKHYENTVTVFRNEPASICPDSISKCVFPVQFDGTGANTNFPTGEDLSGC